MKRLQRISVVALSIASVMAIVACQNSAQQSQADKNSDGLSAGAECRTVQHEMGSTEICGQPQRIVVFGPANLESLLLLDVHPAGYATDITFFQGDYDNPIQQIPYLGNRIASLKENRVTKPIANVGTMHQPSIEAILKTEPDLIIGTEFDETVYDTLARIAPTLLLDYYSPEENLRAIAQAVNRTESVEPLLVQTQQRIATAKEAFAPIVAAYPKVLLLSGSQLQNIRLEDAFDACGSSIKELGFQLVYPSEIKKNHSDGAVPISLESLPAFKDVDLILFLGYNFSYSQDLDSTDSIESYQLSGIKQAWKESPVAQSLEQSKADKVYFLQGYLCGSLPGPIGTELYLEELQEQLLFSKP